MIFSKPKSDLFDFELAWKLEDIGKGRRIWFSFGIDFRRFNIHVLMFGWGLSWGWQIVEGNHVAGTFNTGTYSRSTAKAEDTAMRKCRDEARRRSFVKHPLASPTYDQVAAAKEAGYRV